MECGERMQNFDSGSLYVSVSGSSMSFLPDDSESVHSEKGETVPFSHH